jgi:hypothetical protein
LNTNAIGRNINKNNGTNIKNIDTNPAYANISNPIKKLNI